MDRLYQSYKDRCAFFVIYIREAHPDSLLLVDDGAGEKGLEKIEQTDTLDERRENAAKCLETLDLSIPGLVDGEDNKVNSDYAGWPDRIVIVGRDGAIAYKGGLGPAGFKPDELEDWLKTKLGP